MKEITEKDKRVQTGKTSGLTEPQGARNVKTGQHLDVFVPLADLTMPELTQSQKELRAALWAAKKVADAQTSAVLNSFGRDFCRLGYTTALVWLTAELVLFNSAAGAALFFAVGITTALAARFFGSKKKAAERRADAFKKELEPLAQPIAERLRKELEAVPSLNDQGKKTVWVGYPCVPSGSSSLMLEFKNDGNGFTYAGARVR